MLRYAERELEMQRMLMGKGRSKKVKGVERVEESDEEGEDSGRRGVEEKEYRPRVFRWRAERKR
jgi:U3 small nucleolar RNA-associated protein 11